MIRRFFIIFALMLLTASCAPSNKHTCIPSGTSGGGAATGSETDAEGNTITKLEELELYLKEQKIISTIVTEIKSKLLGDAGNFGSSEKIFTGLVSNAEYQAAIGAAFTLFIIIYGVAILGGLVQATVGEAAIRIAKVAFIATIAMSWGEFYEVVGSAFINTMDELIKFFLQAFGDLYFNNPNPDPSQDIIFADLDIFVSRIFSPHTFALMGAMTNSTSGLIPIAGLLGFSMYFLMIGIVRTVTTYIYAIFALSLLFALAPIFLAFMLFGSTKTMFDNWVNMMINYTLQPVMVCAFMGMYIGLLAPFLQDLLQYKLCYGPLGSSSSGEGWYFVNPDDSTNQQVPFSASSEPPYSLQSAMLFFVFSWLFGANVLFAAQLAAGLSPSFGSDLTKSNAWKEFVSSNPNKHDGLLNMFKNKARNT